MFNNNQPHFNQNWQSPNQLTAIDIISIMSFMIGLQNLEENREQSAHNDVQLANDKQAEFLLQNINSRFENIESKLDKILEVIEKYGISDSDIR